VLPKPVSACVRSPFCSCGEGTSKERKEEGQGVEERQKKGKDKEGRENEESLPMHAWPLLTKR